MLETNRPHHSQHPQTDLYDLQKTFMIQMEIDMDKFWRGLTGGLSKN